MTLQSRAIRILRGRAANNVEFTFTASNGITVEVDRTSFGRVADAIQDGRVVLRLSRSLEAGTSAEYDAVGPGGRIYVRSLRGRVAEGVFIHECVHASCDLTYSTIPTIDSEAAGFIAEAIYWRRTGLGRWRYHTTAWPAAIKFADTYLRTQAPDPWALDWLHKQILRDPTYAQSGRRGLDVADG